MDYTSSQYMKPGTRDKFNLTSDLGTPIKIVPNKKHNNTDIKNVQDEAKKEYDHRLKQLEKSKIA